MSEPAIRNYELENRSVSEKQLTKIASALGVSTYALSDPNLETYIGVMHALFELEQEYGLELKEIDGKVYLNFNNNTMIKYIREWYYEKELYKKGNISKEEYHEWKYTFPDILLEQMKRNGGQ